MTTAMRRWTAVENQSDSSQCTSLQVCSVCILGRCHTEGPVHRGPQVVTLDVVQEVGEQPDHQEPQDSSQED